MCPMQQVKRPFWVGRVTFSNSLLTPVRDVWLSRIVLFCAITLLASSRVAEGQTTIVSIVPANGATSVSGDTPVVFTFSTNMDTAATFTFFFAGTSPVLVSPSWSADGTRMTNTPASSFPGGTTINWMVMGQSAAGDMLGGTTTGSFTTGSGGPTIVSTVPATGTTNVALTAPVVITFSVPMDTAETMVQFLNNGTFPPTFISTTPSWSADGLRLTNTPAPSFPGNTTIIWLADGQDTLGTALEGQMSGIFMTGTGGGAAPTIVTMIPANLATNVALGAPVIFAFSTAMNTNTTEVQFKDASAPLVSLPVTKSWSADRTWLTNTPSLPFPAGGIIIWSAAGQDLAGSALAATTGMFWTAAADGGQTNASGVGLLSRGVMAEQVDTNLLQTVAQEFLALAGKAASSSVTVTPPLQVTNTLAATGTPDALEFVDRNSQAASFATNYPPGAYQFIVTTTNGVATAAISLSDGLLPPVPRLLNWQDPPRAILAQPWSLQWSLDGSGAGVDYLRLRIEQNGMAVFATPLPGAAGALNSASNSIVVPAGVFTNAGRAEVSITAFSYTMLDTNSIPGAALHAARHRTTTFELYVVDGSVPPPVLLTTNLVGVPVGEPTRNPLRATSRARPLHFALISGDLPPGIALESAGGIFGQAGSEGTFDATLRLTDLLGQSTTQALRVVTVPLPPSGATPWLENVGRGIGSAVRFDVVGGANADCLVERSTNLVNWTTYVTTNAPTNRLTLQVPITGNVAFFRVRGPGTRPTPHPLTVLPTLNSNVTVSARIDDWGGTLNLTNTAGYVFALTVPPGALDRSELITMTDVAQIQGLPLSGGLRAAVDLQPEGLIFDVLARLDITAPAAVDPRTLLGFNAMSDGREFALCPSFITNRTVSLYLRHFTVPGMGDGTATDQSQNVPSDPMTAADQMTEAARQACLLADCGPFPDSIKDELVKLYIQMADQVVLPKLKNAVQDPSDAVLDDALNAWLSWLRRMQLLGLAQDLSGDDQTGELGKRMVRAAGLASQAISNGIDKACQDCMNHDVWRIYRMLDLCRKAELLGWNYTDKFWKCAKQCLVFELAIESEIVSSDGSVIYSTHTKGKAKLRPQSLDGTDAASVDIARVMLVFTGSGQWDITEMQHTVPARCAMLTAPAAGRLDFPWVKIDLYKKRQVWVPGENEPRNVYVFDPDMTVKMLAGLDVMPKEQRQLIPPEGPPSSIPDLFGHLFHAFHNNELQIPEPGSVGELVLPGPVFNMTGFAPGGPDGVILSKPYAGLFGDSVENTLIELRHTPAQ